MTELWTLVTVTAQDGAITTCQHINKSACHPENGMKSPTFNVLALCGICFLERVSIHRSNDIVPDQHGIY